MLCIRNCCFTLSQCSPADPSLRKNSPRTGRDDPLKLAGHSGTAPVSASRKQPGWSKAELQRLIVREFPPELTLDESEVLCYTENEQNEMEKELTDEISRAWSGMSTRQDKNRKGLKKRTAATT